MNKRLLDPKDSGNSLPISGSDHLYCRCTPRPPAYPD
jgi:hypothetical protein